MRHHNEDVPGNTTIKLKTLESVLRNVSRILEEEFGHVTRLHAPASEAHHDVFVTIGNNDVLGDYSMR